MIYLDNSASTEMDDEVLEAMLPWLKHQYGNASSAYLLGRQARVAIEDAREEIAQAIGAHPAEVLFTSGGTESNNAILKSCCIESNLVNSLAVSAIEHHAVLHPAEYLRNIGIALDILPVDDDGFLNLQNIAEKTYSHNTLISVMHSNNETGALQPLKQLREYFPEAYLHSDAVQSLGKTPLSVYEYPLDFATISAHKIHGPKGVGAMFVRKGIDFKSHQHGGGQERNRRAGTESVALIAGFQYAVRKAMQEMETRNSHMQNLMKLLRTEIAKIPNIRINTPEQHSLPNIVNISLPESSRNDGEALLQMMDMRGIAVSNGSACVSGSMQPSHVLLAMGRDVQEAKAAVRFSVSKNNSENDMLAAAENLAEIIAFLRE